MLRSFWRMLALLALLAASAAPAVADPGPTSTVGPCAVSDICIGVSEPPHNPSPGPSSTGGSGGDGGVQMCSWNGQQWPCWDNDLGWFSSSDGCYYHREDPQPPASDPEWGGRDPAKGAMYERNCRGTGGQLTPEAPRFLDQPPGGPPPVTPYDLGMQAWKKIRLDPPTLHAAPADKAVVGMPVWLWYEKRWLNNKPTTFGQPTATVSVGSLSVTATATLTDVLWFTGDGQSEDCSDPGTPFDPQGDPAAKPSCFHVYKSSSALKQDQKYYLMAELKWHITAVITGTDQNAVPPFDDPRFSEQPLPLKVGEVQVLN